MPSFNCVRCQGIKGIYGKVKLEADRWYHHSNLCLSFQSKTYRVSFALLRQHHGFLRCVCALVSICVTALVNACLAGSGSSSGIMKFPSF